MFTTHRNVVTEPEGIVVGFSDDLLTVVQDQELQDRTPQLGSYATNPTTANGFGLTLFDGTLNYIINTLATGAVFNRLVPEPGKEWPANSVRYSGRQYTQSNAPGTIISDIIIGSPVSDAYAYPRVLFRKESVVGGDRTYYIYSYDNNSDRSDLYQAADANNFSDVEIEVRLLPDFRLQIAMVKDSVAIYGPAIVEGDHSNWMGNVWIGCNVGTRDDLFARHNPNQLTGFLEVSNAGNLLP